MKRIRTMVALMTVLVLLFALVSCAKPSVAGGDENYDPMTEPTFAVEQVSEDGWTTYEPVTSVMLDEYVSTLEQEGFTCIRKGYNQWLYRADMLVSISNNTKAYQKLSMKRYQRQATPNGMSWDQVEKAIGSDGIVFMVEQTPPELYEVLGVQRYVTLIDNGDAGYGIFVYLVSQKNRIFVDENIPPVFADVDGDGKAEIVTASFGPTSGIASMYLNVYTVDNGQIKEKSTALYAHYFPRGLRVEEDGTVWLEYGSNESKSTQLLWQDNKLVPSDYTPPQ